MPKENNKTKLADALVEKLKPLNQEKNFKDFIGKFYKAMWVNPTLASETKNYGFDKTSINGTTMNRNAKETEKLFNNIRLGLDNIFGNPNVTDDNIKVLTDRIDNAINFSKNREALICQGKLKDTFKDLKATTESLWKSSQSNLNNKTQSK